MKTERQAVYRPTDYMYSSALARAKENHLIGKEGLYRLTDAVSLDAAAAILTEYGYFPPLKSTPDAEERDRLLDDTVKNLLNEIEKVLPVFEDQKFSAVTPLRYQYDCNNLKAAIKCSITGADPGSMLFEAGTVSGSDAVDFVNGKKNIEDIKPAGYSRTAGMPKHMSSAVMAARDAYAESRNPRVIDYILDRACYADMTAVADAMDIPYLTEYIKIKIDSTNILSSLRVLKMYSAGSVMARATLESAILPGGGIDADKLTDAAEGGIDPLIEAIKGDPRFEKTAELLSGGETSLSEVEKQLDNTVIGMIKTAKQHSAGAEVPLGYLLGIEGSVRNVRIILAGREAALDPQIIRERLRDSY